MDFDFGAVEILFFYGVAMGLVLLDIIKTRREIAADKRKAAEAAGQNEEEKSSV